jgi:hypothetical protein
MPKKFNLYPRNASDGLDPKLFRNPTAEYRGAPFWCWNNKLDRDQLLRQLGYLKEMGMGGPTMHVRTGLDTEYLGDEYMDIVRDCVRQSKRQKMLAWLYDEDRWPSGSAGGLVTQDERYRARHLLWTCRPYGASAVAATHSSWAGSNRNENGTLLAAFEVELDEAGCLKYYRRLPDSSLIPHPSSFPIWFAYLETAAQTSWFNNQTYVDTLSRPAIERFVEVTHERYKTIVGAEFGKTIPAIFTDEPQFTHKKTFQSAGDTGDVIIPWTTGFGEDLLDSLPELFWELPGGTASVTRYRYHDQLAERFASAFADTVGGWCRRNGIALTGHMMEEPSLLSQTQALGEAMRSYRSFDLPGIDMLCDWHEYTTAKQAQSAAHQFGYPGVLSELYGVTNWDFDFAGHKAQGDWQAALGVTVRVHHLAWVSMAGEAKRDYPASIFYQSPWYKEYRLVEDHFARLNTVLTRGRPGVRVGVIHPVESFWLCFGPIEQTQVERAEREASFSHITDWLLNGLVDFNFICESLLPSQAGQADSYSGGGTPSSRSSLSLAPASGHRDEGVPAPEEASRASECQFRVGKMAYDAIVVPPMRTIRSTTLDQLEQFAGTIIFAGEIPSLVDAVPSDRARKLAARHQWIEFNRARLLDVLAPFRDIEVPGAGTLLYQLREDGNSRHLFICNTDMIHACHHTVRLRGNWSVTEWDTFTGKSRLLPADITGAWTIFEHRFEAHGHLLVSLTAATPAVGRSVRPRKTPVVKEVARLDGPLRVSLSEPNALLLDQAEWRVNGGAWQPREEILRLDNLVRRRVGLPDRTGNIPQPWCDTRLSPVLGTVEVRFTIDCDAPVARPQLALENARETAVTLDGKPVAAKPTGWWVDEAIQTIRLPALGKGRHTLILSVSYTRKSGLEWCYLLGDFGVALAGRHARIIGPVRSLAFGDWTTQGLPFYTGNVTYHASLMGSGQPLALQFNWPRGLRLQAQGQNDRMQAGALPLTRVPLVGVALDGKPVGRVAFAPFRLDLDRVKRGRHPLDLTCYGHRFNAFGSLHNLNHEHLWAETCPDAWRTVGTDWSDEYQLRPMGIVTSPALIG